MAKPWSKPRMMAIAAANAGAGDSAGRSSTQFPVTRLESAMRISIEIEGAVVTGTLGDSEAARDFASLLPFEDYAATEKISDLPKPASTSGAPAGITPKGWRSGLLRPVGKPRHFPQGLSLLQRPGEAGHARFGLRTLASPRIVRGYHPQARALTETPGRWHCGWPCRHDAAPTWAGSGSSMAAAERRAKRIIRRPS